MPAVIAQEHPVAADKQDAAFPFRDRIVFPQLGFVGTLVPSDFAGGHLSARSVFVEGRHRCRGDLFVGRWAERLDGLRMIELQCPERQIIEVASQVGHRSVGKVPPSVPLGTWQIDFVKRPRRSRSDPKIPIDFFGDRLRLAWTIRHINDVAVLLGIFLALESPSSGSPDVGFADRTDRARLDQFDHSTVVGSGMNLGSHLRRYVGPGRLDHDPLGFLDVVSQRFFAIDRLFLLQGWKCRKGMRVFGR